MVEDELVPYGTILREMKRQNSWAEITMYFYEVTPSVPASPASPCTSPTAPSPDAAGTARPPQPVLLPRPSLLEGNEDRDFMMTRFHLVNNK